MKAETGSLHRSTAVGLLLILVGLILFVLVRAPKHAPDPDAILTAHESGLYYFEAEVMAKRLLPDASARWSHIVLDDGAECHPVGHGVWQARGLVVVEGTSRPWEIVFVPETRALLFGRVGETQSGNPRDVPRLPEEHP